MLLPVGLLGLLGWACAATVTAGFDGFDFDFVLGQRAVQESWVVEGLDVSEARLDETIDAYLSTAEFERSEAATEAIRIASFLVERSAAAQDSDRYLAAAEKIYGRLRGEAELAFDEGLLVEFNYGVLLVRQRRFREARDVLEPLEDPVGAHRSGRIASRYWFHLGRAHAALGEASAAEEAFADSVRRDRGFLEPRAARLELALAERDGVDLADDVVRSALEDGLVEFAGESLEAAFANDVWPHDDLDELRDTFARYLTLTSVDTSAFGLWMKRIPREVFDPERTSGLAWLALPKAYRLRAPRRVDLANEPYGELGSYYGAWESVGAPDVLADLLNMLGNDAASRGADRLALQHFAAAWAMSYGVEAAQGLAYLLLDDRSLDREGKLLDDLVDALFTEKGAAYSGGDDELIAQLHALLGFIFERKGMIGDGSDVRSAVFQWEMALAALARIDGIPEAERAPPLREKLARAYAERARSEPWLAEQAADYYLEAASGYARLDLHELERDALEGVQQLVRSIAYVLTEPQEELYNRLL